MIRVAVFADEKIPDSLMTLLDGSDEVELITDFSSPDVFVVYTAAWNRACLGRIKEHLPGNKPPIVVLCKRTDEPFATDSVRQEQVAGVLPIHSAKEQIVLALLASVAGLRILHPSLNGKGLLPETTTLTPRELEILRLIADGEGNKSIAYLLQISEHTVKFHISSIFEKLHVSSRTEAVNAGITRGLISI